MKKGSPVSKKPNKIKSKVKGPSKVLKQVKQLAQGLARAMSAKPAKKAQTKPAPKTSKASKAATPVKKGSSKVEAKIEAKSKKAKATPAVKAVPPKSVPSKPAAPKSAPAKAQAKKGKGEDQGVLPLPTVAPLVKPGKGAKGQASGSSESTASVSGGKGRSGKGTKPALQVHNEKMCRETGCENSATTKGYCRLDYIKNWKKIKRKEMILKEGKLNQYIEELVSKYPDKYIDVIRQDLSSEVNFNKVIHDLELDESMEDLDYDSDSIDSLIGSIRKEDDGFDDTDF